MLVKIISGTYGHRPILPNGQRSHYVIPVRAGEAPIDVDKAEADRLIGLGVAEAVKAEKIKAPKEEAPKGASEGENGQVAGTLDPEQLKSMRFDDLKALAKDMGVADIGKIKSKGGMIEAICNVEVYADADPEEDPDDEPETDPEEDPPKIDPQDVVD